jgi:hypothetical protein
MIVAIDTNIANSSTKDNAQNKSSIEDNTNLQNSNVAVINQLIFEMYCKKKNVQVYILDCKTLHDIEYTMHELIIEAMMKSSQKIFEKYKDLQTSFIKWKQMNCQNTIRKIMKETRKAKCHRSNRFIIYSSSNSKFLKNISMSF